MSLPRPASQAKGALFPPAQTRPSKGGEEKQRAKGQMITSKIHFTHTHTHMHSPRMLIIIVRILAFPLTSSKPLLSRLFVVCCCCCSCSCC
ncbi:hypothetical protein BD289DRAFT_25893 [Coniella lustricola]|uniref:Uncharacterized protein n=1 Tax=Coniella lustricola TaxID=2025994 RepID=A0A2T3A343_9PEZI|nr:hypothetical protein BD289DRAFT_25893 [Coniella lustricola]